MSRSQPSTPRGGWLRWLLAVIALVGVGVLQGGHCVEATPAGPVAASVMGIAATPGADTGEAPSVDRPGTRAIHGTEQGCGQTQIARDWQFPLAIAVGVTTGVVRVVPSIVGASTRPIRPKPRPASSSPGVAPAQLGILRT